jgi:hypothetical protein
VESGPPSSSPSSPSSKAFSNLLGNQSGEYFLKMFMDDGPTLLPVRASPV